MKEIVHIIQRIEDEIKKLNSPKKVFKNFQFKSYLNFS